MWFVLFLSLYTNSSFQRTYELNLVQKIFISLSYSKSRFDFLFYVSNLLFFCHSLCSNLLTHFEKAVILVNLLVYILSWQGTLL
jgi:hypothetical protein